MEYWHEATGLSTEDVRSWLVLANPYFGGVESWLEEWSAAYPHIPILGGLASATNSEIFLLRDGEVSTAPLLAIAFNSDIADAVQQQQGILTPGSPSQTALLNAVQVFEEELVCISRITMAILDKK